MNREKKFRAWDGTKMHYENIVIYLGEAWLEKSSFESDKILLESTNPCIPMQYTGLQDKNGKEIYEGDVIKTPHKLMKEYKWRVVFHKGAFVLSDGIGYRHFYSQKYSQKYEIIGNIYENPELIHA